MPLPSRVSDLTGFDLLLSVTRTGSIGRAARLRPVWTAGRRLTGPARSPRPGLNPRTQVHSRPDQEAGDVAGGVTGQFSPTGKLGAGTKTGCERMSCRWAAVASASVPT